MLAGFCVTLPAETHRRLEKNELVFVVDGALKLGKTEISKGMGAARLEGDEIELSARAPSPTRCLFLRFDGSQIKTVSSSAGIKDGEIFEFSVSDEFEKAMKCFFSETSTYDNAMLEHGIAYVFLSFVTQSGQADSYIAKTERYIEENLGSPIKIDDISASLSITRGHLRNVFYKEKGISPQEYLMQRRIERAKLLLCENKLPVASVAAAVGYSDALGFSRIFKKHTGVSPSEYREGYIKSSDNAIKNRDIPIKGTQYHQENEIKVEKNVSQSAEDITAALALEIEKAASAARAELERKEDEKKSPPPFWLL